ncbi:MAG: glycosyltransferase [Desulfomicrobium sp.]|nr:glycosyltransferase [Desulfomicrobium sp.]
MTDISIIIPTYNYGAYIGKCLESVIPSLENRDEVIVVDDGSTDITEAVVMGFQEPRLAYHRQENAGPSTARNNGFSLSKGSYVMFLDADDLLGQGQLAAMRNTAENNPDRAVYGPWVRFEQVADGRVVLEEHGESKELDLLRAWLRGWYISPCALLWPREAVERVGGFDFRFRAGEDGEFAKRAMIAGVQFVYSEAPPAWNRKHGATDRPSLSDDRTLTALRQRLQIFQKIESLLQEKGKLREYRNDLAHAVFDLGKNQALNQPGFARECYSEFRRLRPWGKQPGTYLNWLGIALLGLDGKQRVAMTINAMLRKK